MFEAALKMDPGSGAGMTNSGAGMTNSGAGMTNSEAGMTNSGAGMTNSEAGMTKRRARLGFTQIYTTDTSSACKKAMITPCNNS
jgi:hypothetical protein